jgi:hypothetical protein
MKNKPTPDTHPQAGMTIYQRLEAYGWKKTFEGSRFDYFQKKTPVSNDTYIMTVPHTTRTPIRFHITPGKIYI